jgi:hypothetical protein
MAKRNHDLNLNISLYNDVVTLHDMHAKQNVLFATLNNAEV